MKKRTSDEERMKQDVKIYKGDRGGWRKEGRQRR